MPDDGLDVGAFINDDSVQLAMKRNAANLVQLSDLLPKGMDVSYWVNLDEVIAAGITFYVHHQTAVEAEICVQ
ncbi:hypothetical protein [Pseudomonas zeae]|uniref:Uncharacterized protein n=1 Tax=Pseudomonas zeae TaxID=2745510 RepID=A0A9E6TB03_9PSED|nr:hypothetical protein [Pseudomonas zeae]QXI11255.1 hypothetical protein HU754_026285 [Pseudomonas zeae]